MPLHVCHRFFCCEKFELRLSCSLNYGNVRGWIIINLTNKNVDYKMFYDTARSFKHVQTTVICVDVLVSAL